MYYFNVKGTVPYCTVISLLTTSTGSKSEPFIISVMTVVFSLTFVIIL